MFVSYLSNMKKLLCSENVSNDSTGFIPFHEARYTIIIIHIAINLDENL